MGFNSTLNDLITVDELQHESLPTPFACCYHDAYGQMLYNEQKQVVIIEALSSYIPIDDFKNLFNEIYKLADQKPISKTIFDKRGLRTFHQPSMEWYFVDWKTNLFKRYGIYQHIKLLPDLKWFNKAVEAGKAEIFSKYEIETFNYLSIEYHNSIIEALAS